MPNNINKIRVHGTDYTIIDSTAIHELPEGEVNLTLDSASISDGVATFGIEAGSNITFSNGANGKTRINASAGVTGVKGNNEQSYRTGNINLTAANIGAAPSTHTHGGTQVIYDGTSISEFIGQNMTANIEYLALNKQENLVSGTNIKTINNQSILGSGNISTSTAWGSITGTLSNQTDLNNELTNIREVAEGKCKSYVLSYNATVPTQDTFSSFDLYREDHTKINSWQEFIEYCGRQTGPTSWEAGICVNNKFNSQAALLEITDIGTLDTPNYILVIADKVEPGAPTDSWYYTVVKLPLSASEGVGVKQGDIFIVAETDVPDRWYANYAGLYKLETSKIDLNSYIRKSGDTMNGDLKLDGNKLYVNNGSAENYIDGSNGGVNIHSTISLVKIGGNQSYVETSTNGILVNTSSGNINLTTNESGMTPGKAYYNSNEIATVDQLANYVTTGTTQTINNAKTFQYFSDDQYGRYYTKITNTQVKAVDQNDNNSAILNATGLSLSDIFKSPTSTSYNVGKIVNGGMNITLPTRSGTIALTSDIPSTSSFVQKSGDTMTGTLTTRNLIPEMDDAYTLGSSTNVYTTGHINDLYVKYISTPSANLNLSANNNIYLIPYNKAYYNGNEIATTVDIPDTSTFVKTDQLKTVGGESIIKSSSQISSISDLVIGQMYHLKVTDSATSWISNSLFLKCSSITNVNTTAPLITRSAGTPGANIGNVGGTEYFDVAIDDIHGYQIFSGPIALYNFECDFVYDGHSSEYPDEVYDALIPYILENKTDIDAFVKKSGDTMTGDLEFGKKKVYFQDSVGTKASYIGNNDSDAYLTLYNAHAGIKLLGGSSASNIYLTPGSTGKAYYNNEEIATKEWVETSINTAIIQAINNSY